MLGGYRTKEEQRAAYVEICTDWAKNDGNDFGNVAYKLFKVTCLEEAFEQVKFGRGSDVDGSRIPIHIFYANSYDGTVFEEPLRYRQRDDKFVIFDVWGSDLYESFQLTNCLIEDVEKITLIIDDKEYNIEPAEGQINFCNKKFLMNDKGKRIQIRVDLKGRTSGMFVQAICKQVLIEPTTFDLFTKMKYKEPLVIG